MLRRLFTVLGAAAIATTVAFPATAQVMDGMHSQLSARAKTADHELNMTYRKLMANLSPKARQALAQSELAWLDFRQAEIAAHAGQQLDGTIQPIMALDCDIRLLQQRTAQLRRWIDQVRAKEGAWTPAVLSRMLAEQKGAYAQADHLLNQHYKLYMRLNTTDGRRLMTRAQLAWITFRDKEAAFGAALATNKAAADLARMATLAGVTGARAEDLADRVKELEAH